MGEVISVDFAQRRVDMDRVQHDKGVVEGVELASSSTGIPLKLGDYTHGEYFLAASKVPGVYLPGDKGMYDFALALGSASLALPKERLLHLSGLMYGGYAGLRFALSKGDGSPAIDEHALGYARMHNTLLPSARSAVIGRAAAAFSLRAVCRELREEDRKKLIAAAVCPTARFVYHRQVGDDFKKPMSQAALRQIVPELTV